MHEFLYIHFLSSYITIPYQFSHTHTQIKCLMKQDFPTSIRRFKSMNSVNTATSIATSIDSITSEVNQNDSDEGNDDDDFEIIESTRL